MRPQRIIVSALFARYARAGSVAAVIERKHIQAEAEPRFIKRQASADVSSVAMHQQQNQFAPGSTLFCRKEPSIQRATIPRMEAYIFAWPIERAGLHHARWNIDLLVFKPSKHYDSG